jgi:hypothetical protein
MKRAAIAAISVVLFATLAAAAGATQRYAAPAGSGTACFQNAPCSLGTAVEDSKAGDEVIVGPGVHSLPQPATPEFGTAGIDIHGDPSGPMPTVVFAEDSSGFLLYGGSRLSYLAIVAGGFQVIGVSCRGGDLVERVVVSTSGVEPVGLQISEECAARNALVRAGGEDAVAIFARPEFAKVSGPVRNVTALATGIHSVGIATRNDNPAMGGDNTLDVRNAIASGEENDLRAIDSAFGRAHIAIANSNFDVASGVGLSLVKDLGGNQGAPPLFVDAAAGDFREAAGSPTIDAGAADQIGELDLAGAPRLLGPAPDIGAYEFPSPAAAPGRLRSLRVAPRRFRSIGVGGPTGGGIIRQGRTRPPIRTRVTFGLSAAATVSFEVSRAVAGRRVGGRCKRRSPANRGRKRCTRLLPLKGGFTVDGIGGENAFTLSGRLAGRTLRRGSYRLIGTAGGATKRSPFTVAGVFRPAPK